jgi:membrane protein
VPTPIPSWDQPMESHKNRIWRIVSHSPLHSLWKLEGVSVTEIIRRTAKSTISDRVFGRAAELGFYFLFAIFPALVCASAILGMAARSAHQIYTRLLANMALLVPASAMDQVLNIFNQTAAGSSSGKITFGLLVALWSASVGISAIQDTLNDVYKIEDSRSYFGARLRAIALTLLVGILLTLCLASIFGGTFTAALLYHHISGATGHLVAKGVRLAAWAVATALLVVVFGVIYYWAPDWRQRRWRWFTPGAAIGVLCWLLASVVFRTYLHYFNTYGVTYGSLGAVIILMMWFYITGAMLLIGAEINSQIEAAVVEQRIRTARDAHEAQPPRAA